MKQTLLNRLEIKIIEKKRHQTLYFIFIALHNFHFCINDSLGREKIALSFSIMMVALIIRCEIYRNCFYTDKYLVK